MKSVSKLQFQLMEMETTPPFLLSFPNSPPASLMMSPSQKICPKGLLFLSYRVGRGPGITLFLYGKGTSRILFSFRQTNFFFLLPPLFDRGEKENNFFLT